MQLKFSNTMFTIKHSVLDCCSANPHKPDHENDDNSSSHQPDEQTQKRGVFNCCTEACRDPHRLHHRRRSRRRRAVNLGDDSAGMQIVSLVPDLGPLG